MNDPDQGLVRAPADLEPTAQPAPPSTEVAAFSTPDRHPTRWSAAETLARALGTADRTLEPPLLRRATDDVDH